MWNISFDFKIVRDRASGKRPPFQRQALSAEVLQNRMLRRGLHTSVLSLRHLCSHSWFQLRDPIAKLFRYLKLLLRRLYTLPRTNLKIFGRNGVLECTLDEL